MITKIDGSFVVAFDGEEHRLIRDGVVVYEDDVILTVGKSYSGKVDHVINAKGKLVCPGFINIHALTSVCITHFRVDGLGTGSFIPNEDKMLAGLARPRAYVEGKDIDISSRFCFSELLKGGATTIVEITAFGSTGLQPPREQAETFSKTAGVLGARAYISHPFLDGKQYIDGRGERRWHFDEESGLRALKNAVRFCEEYEGLHEDRVRTMLFPYRFDSCSATLLKETNTIAEELNLPIHMHTSQYLPEYYESLRRYGKTPISFLHDIGFLGPRVILTHSLFTSNNPFSPAPNTMLRDIRDIRYLAETGTTVAHTPVIWARAGLILHSYAQYRKAGVNIAIGTDAFPMDMIMEMRQAALQGKIADRYRGAVTARDVFNASTLGGSKALGRDDLGRLAPGAKADIVIVDLTGVNMALTHDPIKALVYFGSQKDIETVIVDGRKVVEDGLVPGVDEEKLAREADELNQRWVRRMGIDYPPSFNNWEK